MAAQLITKVIVKNLPEQWTQDHVQNFLEVVTSLLVAENGVVQYRGITHTVLLTLGEAVTEESLREDRKKLTQTPFDGMTLDLQAVTSSTCGVLVSYNDQQLTHDHIFYYFDNPARSGCGDAEVTNCEMLGPEIGVAVVHFSLPEGVSGVVAKGNHVLKEDGEVVKVEPWYEEFHRPLLQHLISGSRPKVKPPVAPKPSVTRPPPATTSPMPPDPFSSQSYSEIEELRQQNEMLRRENIKLKTVEAENRQKAHNEAILQHKTENERLKHENEKLKKQASVQLSVPSHQLRLMADFASASREGCKVTLMEQEEVALFHGIEEDCEEARREFLLHLQKLTEDTILLSEAIFTILETSRGRGYVEDMVQRYPGCAAKVCNSQLLCAASGGGDLDGFKMEFERNVICRTCKVPPSLRSTPPFQALKLQVERDFMVMVTLPTGPTEDVQVEGINGDVELAARDLDQFTNLNRSDSQRFHMVGSLQGKAVRQWLSRELDEAKQLILKNGEIEAESDEDGYTLTFQCRQEILSTVLSKLEAVRNSTVSVKVDLNKEFPKYSERALVINGLHSMGARTFCSHLEEKLKAQGLDSLGDFRLPDVCSIPQFRLHCGKSQSGFKRKRGFGGRGYHHSTPAGGSDHQRVHQHSSQRHRSYPPLPCSVNVGGTTITIKTGDITAEQVGAAVCVVGQDLGLKGTAIGSAFLKKCPSLAQTLQANGAAGGDVGECRLVTTATAGSSLPMPVVFHAVVKKLQRPAVKKVVRDLVHQSLQLMIQNGQTSIAFPPIGVGRRFGFGEYTTASSMAFAFKEFLQASPNAVQTISVVVYDTRLAGKFAQIITQKLGTPAPVPAAAAAAVAVSIPTPTPAPPPDQADDNSSDTGDDDDDNNDEVIVLEEQEAPDLSDSPRERFEAEICTVQAEDCKKVIDILLGELKVTFLWHETLHKADLDTFYRLGQPLLQEILRTALNTNVYLSLSEKGLRLCGQKHHVHQLLAGIRDKMLVHIVQQSSKVWDKRSARGLPVDTDRLPSYWKVCRKEKDHSVSYDKAIAAWRKRGNKLNSVTNAERAEVISIVQATWEADKAGAGKDARNLTHTKIQVTKVERLENPVLWQEYSHRRERLFSKLEHRHVPPLAHFTPIDQLGGSRGAVQTTANIAAGSALCREVYQQVNEHYLFHGTKAAILPKIYGQGLDFRMASSRTMLGAGVYAAESSTKADQYTDFKLNRTAGEQLTMILMRVLLGEPFIHKEASPQAFKRPPCMSCSQRDCACHDSRLFDSIIDDATRIFREFVVYDQSVCYPEYFITYQRV